MEEERSKMLSQNELITMAIDLHRTDITVLLKGLCKDGLLLSSGFGRGTVYSANRNFMQTSSGKVASKVASSDRKRLDYQTLSRLIIECCSTWKTRQEISTALCYSADYLRNRVLSRMIADGYLETLDKKALTSPQQKYKATEKGKRLIQSPQKD